MEFTPFSPQSFRTSVPSRCDERDGGSEAAPLLGTLVCVVPEFVTSYSNRGGLAGAAPVSAWKERRQRKLRNKGRLLKKALL